MKRCPLILFLVVLVESSSILSRAVPYNALSQNSCVAPVCISKSSYWGCISAFVPKSGCGARGFGMQKENRGRFQAVLFGWGDG